MCSLDKIRTRFRQSQTKKISLSQLFRHYGCKYLRKCFFKSFLSLRPISVLNLKWFYQANQKLLAFKDLCNLQTRNLQTRFKIAISQEPLVLESWNFGCDVFLLSPTTYVKISKFWGPPWFHSRWLLCAMALKTIELFVARVLRH